MPLVLHLVAVDGSTSHQPFSQSAWEQAGRDPRVARKWGHDPATCEDPVAAHWARLRRQGWKCSPSQHAWADLSDPSWEGARSQTPAPPADTLLPTREPLTIRPIVWPPEEVELHPWMLAEMAHMCLEDARAVLTNWRQPKVKEPEVDRRGQFSLF